MQQGAKNPGIYSNALLCRNIQLRERAKVNVNTEEDEENEQCFFLAMKMGCGKELMPIYTMIVDSDTRKVAFDDFNVLAWFANFFIFILIIIAH